MHRKIFEELQGFNVGLFMGSGDSVLLKELGFPALSDQTFKDIEYVERIKRPVLKSSVVFVHTDAKLFHVHHGDFVDRKYNVRHLAIDCAVSLGNPIDKYIGQDPKTGLLAWKTPNNFLREVVKAKQSFPSERSKVEPMINALFLRYLKSVDPESSNKLKIFYDRFLLETDQSYSFSHAMNTENRENKLWFCSEPQNGFTVLSASALDLTKPSYAFVLLHKSWENAEEARTNAQVRVDLSTYLAEESLYFTAKAEQKEPGAASIPVTIHWQDIEDKHSLRHTIEISTEWQEQKIPLSLFVPEDSGLFSNMKYLVFEFRAASLFLTKIYIGE
jgi:hypothetical protein